MVATHAVTSFRLAVVTWPRAIAALGSSAGIGALRAGELRHIKHGVDRQLSGATGLQFRRITALFLDLCWLSPSWLPL